jgi:hypothetical protein
MQGNRVTGGDFGEERVKRSRILPLDGDAAI